MELRLLTKNEFVTSWIAFLMIMAFWITCGSSENPCFTLVRSDPFKHSRLSYMGKPLRREVVYARVSPNNQPAACPIDLCDIVFPSKQLRHSTRKANPKQSYKLTSLQIQCPVPVLVTFRAQNCSLGTASWYDVSLNHCKIRTSDVHRLLGSLNASGVGLNDSEVEPLRSRSTHIVTSGHLETLALENIDLRNRFNDLCPSTGICKNVSMCRLVNVSLHQLPDGFHQRFPHLQYLDLSRNSFREPPSFPWNTELAARVLLKHINFEGNILLGLPDDVSPVVLILDNNNITSLSNFTFREPLNALSLVQNRLEEIGDQTFLHLRDLIYLNLSDNNLRSISPLCSASECKLQTLDLRNNLLQHISVEIFRTLKELRVLNIANNKLKKIEQGTLSDLGQLRTLSLENNEIAFIHRDSFPKDNVFLQEIFLQNNPLAYIPEAVIFLPRVNLVELSRCRITFSSLLDTINSVNIHSFTFFLNKEAATRTDDFNKAREELLKRRQNYKRTISLSGNQIASIPAPIISDVSNRDQVEMERKFRLLLVYYKFELTENPLQCDCKMADFLDYISNHTKPSQQTFLGNEYFFRDWKCSGPHEFAQQTLFAHKSSDLYCQTVNVTCPARCKCYTYARSTHGLVDCQNSRKVALPLKIPKETLTLRLNYNNITQLTHRDYLTHLQSLNLSTNNLKTFSSEVLRTMTKLRHLYLDHNALQTLPRIITRLDGIREITLSNNRFRCDCHNVWLKSWLLLNDHRVKDVSNVFCTKSDKTVSVMIRVDDTDFVCVRGKNLTYFHVCMSITSCLVLGIVISFVSYFFRLELRALIYASFIVRLFDTSTTNPDEDELIKILIVVADEDYEFFEQHLLPLFPSADTSNSLAVTCRDFIVGLSRVQNASFMVKHSFRMIAVVTEKFLSDDVCRLALDKGLTKARTKKQFLVIFSADATDRTNLRDINPRLHRFYKTRRRQCVGQSDILRDKKLKYLTSAKTTSPGTDMTEEPRHWWHVCLQSLSVSETSRSCPYDVYIAYDSSDFQWAFCDLRCKLETEGFSTRLSDLHFIPGQPIQDNIDHCVSSCRYVLLVLSSAFVANEWSLFVFRTAYERTLRENNNSLIVITTEDLVPSSIQDEDLSLLLRTHAYLDRGNADWWLKLRRSLTKGSRLSSVSDDLRLNDTNSANTVTEREENVVVEEAKQFTDNMSSPDHNSLIDNIPLQDLNQPEDNVHESASPAWSSFDFD